MCVFTTVATFNDSMMAQLLSIDNLRAGDHSSTTLIQENVAGHPRKPSQIGLRLLGVRFSLHADPLATYSTVQRGQVGRSRSKQLSKGSTQCLCQAGGLCYSTAIFHQRFRAGPGLLLCQRNTVLSAGQHHSSPRRS